MQSILEAGRTMSQLNAGDRHHPYLIVAAFPGKMPRAIGRTYNQSDAEEHVRFLQRRMNEGMFYIVFEPEPATQGTES
jgi:hypothetical protein